MYWVSKKELMRWLAVRKGEQSRDSVIKKNTYRQLYLIAAMSGRRKTHTNPLFIWLHKEAKSVEVIEYSRVYF